MTKEEMEKELEAFIEDLSHARRILERLQDEACLMARYLAFNDEPLQKAA